MAPGRSPIPPQPGWGIRNRLRTPGEGLPQSRARAMGGEVDSSGLAARRATSVSSMAESITGSFLPPGLARPTSALPGSHTQANRYNYRHKNRHKDRDATFFSGQDLGQGAPPEENWDRTWDKNRDTLVPVSGRGQHWPQPAQLPARTPDQVPDRAEGPRGRRPHRQPRGRPTQANRPHRRAGGRRGARPGPPLRNVILAAILSTVPSPGPGLAGRRWRRTLSQILGRKMLSQILGHTTLSGILGHTEPSILTVSAASRMHT